MKDKIIWKVTVIDLWCYALAKKNMSTWENAVKVLLILFRRGMTWSSKENINKVKKNLLNT